MASLADFRTVQAEIRAGRLSFSALAHDVQARIEALNPALNAFVHTDAAAVHAQAQRLQARLDHGESLPLAGMVVGVKDVICTTDFHTTCSSKMLARYTSPFDATAVVRLREAGALVVGKLNCDEFAMGSSNENSAYGPVQNPAAPGCVPGGSSGGSAAAVAAGLVHLALGTDTGGSIRQPAAFCGVPGLKPTYGRVSRYGLVAFASSFDVMGPFGQDLDVIAAAMDVMAGHDPADSTCLDAPAPTWSADTSKDMRGMRIGVPREYFGAGLDPEVQLSVREALDRLKALGAVEVPVSLPHTRYGIAAYYILTTAEASSNLSRYDGVRYGHRTEVSALPKDQRSITHLYTASRTEGFGPEVKRRILLGTFVLSAGYYDAYYGRAQRVRRLVQQDFEQAFAQCDVLLTPATPTPAFRIGEKVADPLALYLEDVFTVSANLAGIPGLVVPGRPHPDGRPIGVQVLGPLLAEGALLRVGRALA